MHKFCQEIGAYPHKYMSCCMNKCTVHNMWLMSLLYSNQKAIRLRYPCRRLAQNCHVIMDYFFEKCCTIFPAENYRIVFY